MYACYLKLSYYLIALLVFAWIFVVFAVKQAHPWNIKDLWREYGIGILASITLAAIVFITVKPYFRVLDDEANLLSISRAMLFDKKIFNVTDVKWFDLRLSSDGHVGYTAMISLNEHLGITEEKVGI